MPPELFDLAEKVAVVTGGARGLGKAAAQGLAAHGAEVAILDILADEMTQCQTEIQHSGKRCETYPCDVSDEEQVRETAEQVISDFSRIDILVNIAGITNRVATTDITSAAVRHLTEVNYFGMFWCCREFGKPMLQRGQGNIINMSALGGGLLGTGRGNAAYSSTKGAIAALTKELAAEWGPQGIRVNALAPCWFQTDMNANSIFATPTFPGPGPQQVTHATDWPASRHRGTDRVFGVRSFTDDHRFNSARRRRGRSDLSDHTARY